MSAGIAMLYGWVFFALLGGACGFVIGWTMSRAAIAKATGSAS
jgi:hypothetical protein